MSCPICDKLVAGQGDLLAKIKSLESRLRRAEAVVKWSWAVLPYIEDAAHVEKDELHGALLDLGGGGSE